MPKNVEIILKYLYMSVQNNPYEVGRIAGGTDKTVFRILPGDGTEFFTITGISFSATSLNSG